MKNKTKFVKISQQVTYLNPSDVANSLLNVTKYVKRLPPQISNKISPQLDAALQYLVRGDAFKANSILSDLAQGTQQLKRILQTTQFSPREQQLYSKFVKSMETFLNHLKGKTTTPAIREALQKEVANATGKIAGEAAKSVSYTVQKATKPPVQINIEAANALAEGLGTQELAEGTVRKTFGTVFKKILSYTGSAYIGFYVTYNLPDIVRMANDMLGNPWPEETETWIISIGLATLPIIAGAFPATAPYGVGGAIGSAGAAIKEGLKTYSDPEGDVQKAKRALQSEEELNIKLKEAEPHLNKLRAKIQALESQITGPNDPKIDEWIKAVETMHQIDVNIGLPGNRPWYIRLQQARQAGYKSPWHVPGNNASLQGTRIVKTNLRLLANDPNEGWKEIGTMPKGTKVKLLSGKKRFTTRPGVYADYIKVQSEDGRVGWVDSYGLTYANGQNAPAVANAMSSKGLHVIASGPNSIDENGRLIHIAKNTPVRIIPGIRTYDQDDNEAYVYIEMPDGREGWAPKRDLRLLNVTDRMMNCYK